MKTDDKIKDMVSRSEPPRNTFKVNKPDPTQPNPADGLLQEVSAEEAELKAAEEALTQRRTELADKAQKAADALRQQKVSEWQQKMDDAADYAEIAKTATDHDKVKDYFRRAKLAEREAALLAAELNLNVPAPTETVEPRMFQMLSTNKALQLIVALFVLFVGLTGWAGWDMMHDPENPTGQSIMANAPIRALLAFTLTFLTFLVASFFIRVAFPQFYRIWHNRIDSERSLDSLLNEAPAWVVLASLLALFYMFMQVFASFYQAIFA